MKRIYWGCVIMGSMSIVLSISAIFLGYLNLPFQLLITAIQCASIPIQQLVYLKNILRIPFFDYFLSIILVVSGIGTIWLKPWGKFFAKIYAVSMLVLAIISFPIALVGYTKEFAIHGGSWFIDGLIVWGGGLGYVISLLGALLYPVTLLIFFSRPKIKELFYAKSS